MPVPVPRPLAGGQYPTLIEYSGYGYADPPAPVNGIAVLANAMGFAVVDVNMRGTGCSGGAYDFFEPLQNLDGYDVIETVAHQPWVLHHKVGMMGISFGGISQLFTAQTRPPDLAAIAPLSVIDQTQTTLYPGGILNTGFAFTWAKERVHDALPASPSGGQSWAYQQIQQGDETCKDNQALHGEAVNLLGKIRTNNHYVRAVRGFFRWMVRAKRIGANPLDALSLMNAQVDVRRARRELTADELRTLFTATRASGRAFRGLTGEDRYHLYLVAATTGFRASALASLMPGDLSALVAFLRSLPPASNQIPTPRSANIVSYLAGKFRMLILHHDPPVYVYPGNAGSGGQQ